MERRVEPELLDDLPPSDPRAIRSRRDLRRVNSWMRNARSISDTVRSHLEQPPRRILELGAGDGTLLLALAEKLSDVWRGPVDAILLDKEGLVTEQTRKTFASFGWTATPIVRDLRDWIDRDESREYDLILANLFIHHFSDVQIRSLFAAISSRCGAFICCEPRRWPMALLGTKLLWLIGCNRITRHDAIVSVRAGFRETELSKLWPDHHRFRLIEKPASFASHIFFAWRLR